MIDITSYRLGEKGRLQSAAVSHRSQRVRRLSSTQVFKRKMTEIKRELWNSLPRLDGARSFQKIYCTDQSQEIRRGALLLRKLC